MLIKRLIPLILMTLLSAAEISAEKLSFFSPESDEKIISTITGSMSSSQLAGQILMFGYWGEEPSEEILNWISDKNIGGIKIFGWNAENLYKLQKSINIMQNISARTDFAIPLFIATDQEGGWVRHVKGSTSITPGNMALGANSYIKDSYDTGKYIGEQLACLGINMNFAPTVDILINHEAHVIGPRAFSDDPLKTAVRATSFMNGMKESGVISTAKHFPGHGRASDDSHGKLPLIDVTLEELKKTELLPYDFLIKENIPAIMSGHLAFPKITDEKIPASLSPFFLKKLLREEMGFKGLIITDDMRMSGSYYVSGDIADNCLEAVRGGNDIIEVSHGIETYDRIYNSILNEIDSNEDFREQVKESVKRILRIKLEYLKDESGSYRFNEKKPGDIARFIPSPEAEDFFMQNAFRSISNAGNEKNIPAINKNEKILLAGQFKLFFEEGKKRYPEADTYYFPYTPFFKASQNDLIKLPETAALYDRVIFCLANPGSMELLDKLSILNENIIVLSTLSPVYIDKLNWVKYGIAVYGTGRESFTAGFSVISGDFDPEGELPFKTKNRN
jgi:beta-N-acetylhexosaminidase